MYWQQKLESTNRRIKGLDNYHNHLGGRLENTYSRRLTLGVIVAVSWLSIALNIFVLPLTVLTFFLVSIFVVYVIASRRISHAMEQTLFLRDFYIRLRNRVLGHPLEVKLLRAGDQIKLSSERSQELARDLDLVEGESVLALLDESFHPEGQRQLTLDILQPVHSDEEISKRQLNISKLSKHAGLLRKCIRLTRKNFDKSFGLFELLERPLVEQDFCKVFLRLSLLSGLSWLSLFVYAFSKGSWFGFWPVIWAVNFFYSIFCLQKVQSAFQRILDIEVRFESLLPLFRMIEKQSKEFDFLVEFQKKPSQVARLLSREAAFLSVQTHPLLMLLVNGLIPYTYFFVRRAEAHRSKLALCLKPLSTELKTFDALSSLALFHRYQTSCFPQRGEFSFKGAYHPLVDPSRNIANSFSWPEHKKIILITGSNMAGKSTFLRMIGINLVLARMGAPVFANSWVSPRLEIHSCIRVNDSVRDGFSYFFAEAKRISAILRSTESSGVFFLIDEVFKGTNNRERYLGAKSLLEALTKSSALGILTTHDLELSQLNLKEMANFHFKDQIENGIMSFPYTIQPGPCPTTNALTIMKSVGIPISD